MKKFWVNNFDMCLLNQQRKEIYIQQFMREYYKQE